HVLALRDACPCAECRHPVSGQRLFESARVLPTARATAAQATADELMVTWADGHRSTFPLDWVRAQANGGLRARTLRTWTAELPEHDWAAVRDDARARRAWLGDVAELGFSVLHGVPRERGYVETVAGIFGAVRETNYGRVFDVSVSVGATNLADTS